MTMSSARLEVITDDANVTPRMSRALPAALEEVVDAAAYQAYCDRMDVLLVRLYTEQRRLQKRFWWMYGAIMFWLVCYSFAFGIFPTSDFSITLLVASAIGAALLGAICCFLIWRCTSRPTGMKTQAEIMRDIRLECEEMTNHTPFVSFQAVFMLLPRGACGPRDNSSWIKLNTVDHIAVSISASASVVGATNVGSTVTSDDVDGKVHEAADSHEPVV